MISKNLAIAGLTATAVLFLSAIFFLGFRIWFSPTGIGIGVAIISIAFGGAAFNLRRHEAALAASGNPLPPTLPGWVRTWQRIAALLLVLVLLVSFFL